MSKPKSQPIVTWNPIERELARLGIGIDRQKAKLTSDKPITTTPETKRPKWVSKALEEQVPAGERNIICYKLACYLFKHYPRGLAIEMMLRWAKDNCQQPLDNLFGKKEAMITIESAYKTLQRRINVS